MSGVGDPFAQREIALVDLLDRLLAGGVVLAGDITLRIADVDLVRIDLKALISSVGAQVPSPWADAEDGGHGLPLPVPGEVRELSAPGDLAPADVPAAPVESRAPRERD